MKRKIFFTIGLICLFMFTVTPVFSTVAAAQFNSHINQNMYGHDGGAGNTSSTTSTGISINFPTGSANGVDTINTSAKKIWTTVTTIVQILAFAAIVFAGLRYMFASADHKADIKKSLGMLTVGAILVFAASTVVKFVVTATSEVIGN